MQLTVVTLANEAGQARDVIVRNFDGVEAPKGDRHIARFMRKHGLRPVHIYVSPVRDSFDSCFAAIMANGYSFNR